MIHLIEQSTAPESPFPQVSKGDMALPRGVSALGGASIAGFVPRGLSFFVTDGNARVKGLTDFMKGVGVLLVSGRLRAVLDEHRAQVEYWPVDVFYNNSHQEGYFLAVPLQRVRAVDMQASSIELDRVGVALGVDRLVLDESRLSGIPFAIVAETMHFAVDDDLAKAITRSGCTGCAFIDPSLVRF